MYSADKDTNHCSHLLMAIIFFLSFSHPAGKIQLGACLFFFDIFTVEFVQVIPQFQGKKTLQVLVSEVYMYDCFGLQLPSSC